MARILYSSIITLCLLSITMVSSVPQPRGSLHIKNPRPNYERSSALSYQYLGRVTVSLPGGGAPRQLTTDCRVQVSPVTATKRRMTVSECKLTDSISEENKKGDAAFTRLRHDLHKFDVIFVTTPGESHVMIQPGETPTVLNLKRAILSLLTSPMTATSGSTSSLQTHRGQCVVKTSTTEDKNTYITKTFVDLKSCTQSSKITQEFVKLYQPTVGQGLNWTGTEECSFRRRAAGQVEQVDCEEQLRMGSNSHRASLHVQTSRSLTLVDASPTTHEALPLNRYIRSSLHHTFISTSQTLSSNSNDVLQSIHHLQEVSQAARARPVAEQTTFHFRRLRASLAGLGRDALMRVVSDVLGSDVTNYDDVTQGLLVDALASCGTETCVTVILTSPIPINHHVRFLRAMALGQTPSQRTLSVIKETCTSLLAEHCTLPLSILKSRYISSRADRTPDQEILRKAARGLLSELVSSSESLTASSSTWAHYLPLVWGVVITSMGIPVNFTLDSAIVVAADISGTTMEGRMSENVAASLEADIVTSIQLGWSGSLQSGVERSSSWRGHIDSPLTLTTTNGEVSLTMDNLAPSHPIQTRTTTYMNTDGQLNEVLPQSQWCLWRLLDWVTGTDLCRSHGDSTTQYPGVWTSLSNVMEELLGINMKDVILGNGRQLSIKLPIASPDHAHRSARSVLDRVVTAWDGTTPTYTAMVMGENHIVTWDGTAYTLPDYRTRRCAYQLARDVRRHNFTLLQTRHMVELLTKDVAVRVRHDGQVLIDRASTPSDLPYRSANGDVVVTRRSSNIQVMTNFGVDLQYDTKTQNTVFTLSSSYFNHSRGLLGINDGVQHHGYVTRQGQVTHSVYDVVRSYEVSSRPECHPEVDSPDLRHSAPLCDNGVDAHCDELFLHKTSPLSSCFGRADPRTFKTTCQREARRCYQSTSGALTSVCRIAAAYRDLCQAKGVSLQTPTVCAGCGHHHVGASWTQHAGHKVDTVVVAPTGTSHRTVIASIMDALTSALRTGSTPYDLRVGVVAVPGAGQFSNAYSLTFNGDLFSHNPQEEVSSASEQLSHQMGASGSSSHHTPDLEEGLRLATTYPFRPNAVKLILLITDSDSLQDDTSSLTSLLKSQGIIVNVVSPYELLRPKSVAGLLQTGELLTSHGQVLAQQLPQTRYAQVALQSGGILLDPQALTGVTRTLVTRALTTQAHDQRRLCRRCTCQAGNEGFSTCHQVAC